MEGRTSMTSDYRAMTAADARRLRSEMRADGRAWLAGFEAGRRTRLSHQVRTWLTAGVVGAVLVWLVRSKSAKLLRIPLAVAFGIVGSIMLRHPTLLFVGPLLVGAAVTFALLHHHRYVKARAYVEPIEEAVFTDADRRPGLPTLTKQRRKP
jgi:hypothetical protein